MYYDVNTYIKLFNVPIDCKIERTEYLNTELDESNHILDIEDRKEIRIMYIKLLMKYIVDEFIEVDDLNKAINYIKECDHIPKQLNRNNYRNYIHQFRWSNSKCIINCRNEDHNETTYNQHIITSLDITTIVTYLNKQIRNYLCNHCDNDVIDFISTKIKNDPLKLYEMMLYLKTIIDNCEIDEIDLNEHGKDIKLYTKFIYGSADVINGEIICDIVEGDCDHDFNSKRLNLMKYMLEDSFDIKELLVINISKNEAYSYSIQSFNVYEFDD